MASGIIIGAGGVGFILLYCPVEKQKAVKEALRLRQLKYSFELDESKIIYF
ncbi:hypothetical protein ACFLWB_02580 [Chloroflexota bacterium]